MVSRAEIILNMRAQGFKETAAAVSNVQKQLQAFRTISQAVYGTLEKTKGFQNPMERFGLNVVGAGKNVKNFDNIVSGAVKNVNKQLAETKAHSRELRGNMLGMGLSFLFTGMAIKRFADNMVKSLLNTYSQVMGEGTIFREQTNRLTGAFEFLKFSIFDAISQSDIFSTLVDWIVTAVNWLSEFIGQHPNIALMIGVFLALAIIVGTFAMFLGQAVLGVLGLMAAFKLFTGKELTFALMKDSFLANIAVMKLAWAKFTAGMTPLLWVAAFAIMIIFYKIFDNWQKKLGGWSNFWKVVLAGMIATFGLLVDAVITMFLGAIDFLMGGFLILVNIYNGLASKLGRKPISLNVEVAGKNFDLTKPLSAQYAAGAFGGGEGIASNWVSQMMGSDFFGGALGALSDAKDEYGVGGFLNPFVSPNDIPVGDLPEQVNNGTIENTQNNYTQDITVNITGYNPNDTQATIDELAEQFKEWQDMHGGAPQS